MAYESVFNSFSYLMICRRFSFFFINILKLSLTFHFIDYPLTFQCFELISHLLPIIIKISTLKSCLKLQRPTDV